MKVTPYALVLGGHLELLELETVLPNVSATTAALAKTSTSAMSLWLNACAPRDRATTSTRAPGPPC